ncbi:MAG: hypothetical protein JWM11_821 [Planctomycetaceae bacterium]|nr:hypothetical protein [Planctomycetaceae bacterium]
MSTINQTPLSEVQPHTVTMEPVKPVVISAIRLFSHSSLFYWWPVWVAGYIMAALTYLQGHQVAIGADKEWFHYSSDPGVIFFLVLFLVILITNLSVRGLASGMVILGVCLVTVTLAYLGLWNRILDICGQLRIHLNLGAYFWFSTLLFLSWTFSIFGMDRVSYWQVTPGQLTHTTLFGSGSKSYNTQGMTLEKHRSDLFRNWLLGFGSGDLLIQTAGATREQIDVPNVLFIGAKVTAIQRLIAEVPDQA